MGSRYPLGAGPPVPAARSRIPIPTGARDAGQRAQAREAEDFVAYAAGLANVVMQLSWPEVGHGVVESPVDSGNLLRHPIKRARTTFTYLAVAVGGSDDERRAYARAVSAVHAQVRSTPDSAVSYHALHAELQLWVGACLYVGLEDTHQLLHGRLSDRQRTEFLASAAPLATTLQVRAEDWPATPQAFDELWSRSCRRVHVDDTVRAYLNALVDLEHHPRWVQRLLAPRLRFLTTGFLPPLFREQLQWSWSPEQQLRFEQLVQRWARRNARLPRGVRHAPAQLLRQDLRRRIRRGRPLV